MRKGSNLFIYLKQTVLDLQIKILMIFIRLNGTVLILFYSDIVFPVAAKWDCFYRKIYRSRIFLFCFYYFSSMIFSVTEDWRPTREEHSSHREYKRLHCGVFRMEVIREGIQNAGLRMTSQDDRLVKITYCHGVFPCSLVWGCAK